MRGHYDQEVPERMGRSMKITLSDLPEDIRKKIASENKMPRDEKSFQIYASDLSRVFDIGEIADMFVTVIEGKQVLRVRYYDKNDREFPTVKAVGRLPRKPSEVRKSRSAQKDEPETFTEKLAAGAKEFFLNPERNKNKPFGGGRFG